MPSRVSPAEQIRASIDELFADPERDLGAALEEVARLSVRLVFQTALDSEATQFLGRDRYARGDRIREGSRNGYSDITVKTTAGPVKAGAPTAGVGYRASCPRGWSLALHTDLYRVGGDRHGSATAGKRDDAANLRQHRGGGLEPVLDGVAVALAGGGEHARRDVELLERPVAAPTGDERGPGRERVVAGVHGGLLAAGEHLQLPVD